MADTKSFPLPPPPPPPPPQRGKRMQKIDNPILYERLSKIDCTEKAQFVFDSAKMKLLATLDSFKSLQQKNFIFIGYLIAFSGFIMHMQKIELSSGFGVGDFFYTVVLLTNLILLINLCLKNLPVQINDIGNSPNKISDNNALNQKIYSLMISEIYFYDGRIGRNLEINKKIGRTIHKSFLWSLSMITIFILNHFGVFSFLAGLFTIKNYVL